jgi:7-keto-8-aminopelargonate synthetase-like enzyme
LQHLAGQGRGADVASLVGAGALLQVGTLSKALGSQGGFVCGAQWVIEGLVNSARPFIYSTGLNPGSCGAALCSLNLIGAQPQRLARLRVVRQRLARGVADLGYQLLCNESPIMPLLVGDAAQAVALSEALRERGVWCPAIRPPTVPVGQSRLRLTANASFEDEDIERVLVAFAACRPLLNL